MTQVPEGFPSLFFSEGLHFRACPSVPGEFFWSRGEKGGSIAQTYAHIVSFLSLFDNVYLSFRRGLSHTANKTGGGEKERNPFHQFRGKKNGTPGFPGASFEEQDRISSSQGAEHFEGKLVRDGEI